MKILAVDTAFAACSVAILDSGRVLAHRFEEMARGHAERLAPMVEEAVREAGLSFSMLERLGVTVGPGSFTGIRVGLAFMRGLRLALEVPLIGITSLYAMGQNALQVAGLNRVAVVQVARDDEIYCELLKDKESEGPQIVGVLEAFGIISRFAGAEPLVLAGNAQERLFPDLAARGVRVARADIRLPDALWVARVVAGVVPGAEVPKPFYLRAPAARPASRPK